MTNIPFSRQRLPADHLAFVQMSILAGNEVAGDDLLRAAEQSGKQLLPDRRHRARGQRQGAIRPARPR